MMRNVKICGECVRQMLEHAQREAPQECCGLLAGQGGIITHVFPATNALAEGHAAMARDSGVPLRARTEFEIAPLELFRIFKQMRAAGLEHLGIYHSHPATENVPSPRDLERAYYEGAAYFIISLRENAPRPVRAFQIANGTGGELEVQEVEEGKKVEEVEEKNSLRGE